MKIRHWFSVVFTAAGMAFLVTPLVWRSPALADQTVSDTTGRMTSAAIAQIDQRNKSLADATGLIVAVVVDRGAGGESAPDAVATADKFARGKYGAVVWVASDIERSDIIYAGQARRWVPIEFQDILRNDLNRKLQYCCPSDTVPAIVDRIASAMEAGSRVPPDARNYVYDKLGLLDNLQINSIVAREQRVEAATGKGVAVALFPGQAGKLPTTTASAIAASLNVKGEIAAIVWAASSFGSLSFNMIRSPNDIGLIADANADTINSSFQADMQTGRVGDAVVAVVDRTASALENAATQTTPSAAGSALPSQASTVPRMLGSAAPANAPPVGALASAPTSGGSNVATTLLLLLGFAIIIIVIITALRRRQG